MDSNVKLIRDTTDNTSSELGAKITELINEVRTIKKQVDTILRGYVLAKDSNFKWKEGYPWFGAWHYIGTDDKVVVPHTIRGKGVTSHRGMFYSTCVNGVYSDNPNVTDMSYMFSNSHAKTLDLPNLDTSNVTDMCAMFRCSGIKTLDLSNFDTSNVTDMSNMFYGSEVTNLDLSNFDTSKVTNMSTMFADSQIISLDLSSFDTSNVTDMEAMFLSSKVTNGYARTPSDADRFRSSTCKPLGLAFISKPSAS